MRINVRTKITLAFAIVTGCVLAITYFGLQNTIRTYALTRIEQSLAGELRLAKVLLEHDPALHLDLSIDALANMIGTALLMRTTIIDSDGVVLGDSELTPEQIMTVENHLDRSEVAQALATGAGVSHRYSATIHQDMVYATTAFTIDQTSGIIRLAVPLHDVAALTVQLQHFFLGIFTTVFLLAIAIGYVLSIYISRPLTRMVDTAHLIAGGTYDKKLFVSSNDEISDLANAFNLMTTQIKEHIDLITQSKAHLEAVLRGMFDGIMVIDQRGAIVLINDTLRNTLFIHDAIEGRQSLEVIRNLDIQNIIQTILTSSEAFHSREIALLHPVEKTLLVHATAIANGGAVLVFHDITELHRLETIRKDFVANVSHELRTPLSTIKGYAETLLDGAIDDTKNARSFIEIMARDANHLATLINDLLDLSKLESGRYELHKVPCSLHQLVNKAFVFMKKSADARTVALENTIPQSLPQIDVDSDLLMQVFINLIDNAIKYNENDSGFVRISAHQVNDRIEIDVADNGIGIPDADLSRVFERFYRVDKARSRNLGGTGLGLAIVKHIIQQHKGSIAIESAVARGTTFRITLPL